MKRRGRSIIALNVSRKGANVTDKQFTDYCKNREKPKTLLRIEDESKPKPKFQFNEDNRDKFLRDYRREVKEGKRLVAFQSVCSACNKPYGVKLGYPSWGWKGDIPIVSHGMCKSCEKSYYMKNKIGDNNGKGK